MKKISTLLLVLTAFVFAAPTFAQTQDPHAKENWAKNVSAAVERAAVKAVREHKASVCDKCGHVYTIDEKYHGVKHECAKAEAAKPVCARCGQEVRAGQHCSATDYTTLCSAQKEQPASTRSEENSVCAKCGHAYTIDEKYHGVKHECAQAEEAKPVCVRCGEEVRPGQHCDASGYTALCTVSEEEPASSSVEENNACAKCGHVYTIDEKYHGAKHECAQTKNDTTEYCIYCGEAIVKNNQACSAVPGGACTVNCPDCGKNLRDKKNLINGEHRCKFKTRITPVAPKKAVK